jgi:ABC-type sugar transport system substrate-binding protein
MVRFRLSFRAQSCHAATVAAAALALAFASFALATPAAAQMSERQMMKMLGPMMQDENFNEELNDFAEEHDLDPNMLRAMLAKKGGMSKKQLRQMQQQQQQQEKPIWQQQ